MKKRVYLIAIIALILNVSAFAQEKVASEVKSTYTSQEVATQESRYSFDHFHDAHIQPQGEEFWGQYPGTLSSPNNLTAVLPVLKSLGSPKIEVFFPSFSPRKVNYAGKVAKEMQRLGITNP